MLKETELKIAEIETCVRSSPVILPYNQYHHLYWQNVIPLVKNPGLWIEFGVFRGRSLQYISSLTPEIVYGLDSFDGLHEKWDDDNPKGIFNSGGIIPKGAILGENHSMFDSSETKQTEPWNSNVRLIKGYFEDILPNFLRENKDNAAFIHIDSDLYSSCATIFKHMEDRIVSGTIICFDELLDYPTYKEGEIKAFAEFLLKSNLQFKSLVYNNFGLNYTQACVEIL